MPKPGSIAGFVVQVVIVLRNVAPPDCCLRKSVCRSLRRRSFGGARNQSGVRIRLLPTNPPGDWTGVQHPLHGENNGCEKEEGCEEGRRQEEEVGSVRCVTRKPALCAGFLVSGITDLCRFGSGGLYIYWFAAGLIFNGIDVRRESRCRILMLHVRDDDPDWLLRFLRLTTLWHLDLHSLVFGALVASPIRFTDATSRPALRGRPHCNDGAAGCQKRKR